MKKTMPMARKRNALPGWSRRDRRKAISQMSRKDKMMRKLEIDHEAGLIGDKYYEMKKSRLKVK